MDVFEMCAHTDTFCLLTILNYAQCLEMPSDQTFIV